MQTTPHQNLSRFTLLFMAISCAVTISNVYLCQPLLSAIATSFHTSAATAGHVVTAAQMGYALGILGVVPLADRIDPKKLLRIILALVTVALLVAAFSPSAQVLIVATFIVAAVSVIPQVLIPVAVAFSAPEKSGRVLGAMQTGLILGILLSQTIAGAIAQYSGSWRTPYITAAVLDGILFLTLPLLIPQRKAQTQPNQPSYFALIASLPQLFIQWRDLRFSAILSALVFCSFTGFWATSAFHMAQAPFHFGPAQAGLMGISGIIGALIVGPVCGQLADKLGPTAVNMISIGAVVLAYAAFLLGGDFSLLTIIIGINLLNFGNQAGQVANQARIFKLDPAARARLNTVYMVFTFAGGAIGSIIGANAWAKGGWHQVCYAGFILLALAACLMLTRLFRPGNPGKRLSPTN